MKHGIFFVCSRCNFEFGGVIFYGCTMGPIKPHFGLNLKSFRWWKMNKVFMIVIEHNKVTMIFDFNIEYGLQHGEGDVAP